MMLILFSSSNGGENYSVQSNHIVEGTEWLPENQILEKMKIRINLSLVGPLK